MKRLTEKGFVFTEDYVINSLNRFAVVQALNRLREIEDEMEQKEKEQINLKETEERLEAVE